MQTRVHWRSRAVIRAIGAVGVAVAASGPLCGQNQSVPQPAVGHDTAEPMWVQTFPLDEGRHVLLIVDPILRHVAIYHVDTVAGTLTLKSSRDISGDLRLGDFNAQDPKPTALRKMLDGRAPAAAPLIAPP